MVKVSICIPAYNNLSCVKCLCTSIAEQTFTDYEVIITDDSTNQEIEKYITDCCEINSNKINYFHNVKPLGHIFNWNCAIEKARGKYVKIMFSDDWFTFPDSLQKMVQLLEDAPEASLAFCGSRQMKDLHKKRDRYASDLFVTNLQNDYRYLFLGNEIGAPSAVIYRNGKYRFVENSNWASDMFLYFNILQENPHFIATQEPLITIKEHAEQYTNLFSEIDNRKINDYKLMFMKYQLQNFKPAREYMLYLILCYKRDCAYAYSCGFSKKEYHFEKIKYIKRIVIPNYFRIIKYKLKNN